jgi:GT2 family glycosyltransferase
MDNPKIGVVILNWNNFPDTTQCVLSVDRQTYQPHELIIVDNGSDDDSVSRLSQIFPDLKIISTGSNLGYAGGNNIGIRYLLNRGIDAILILNNDVVLANTALEELVKTLYQNDEIKLVAPVTISFGVSPKVIEAGTRFNPYNGYQNRINQGLDPEDLTKLAPFDVDIAPGCAFLAHRDLFSNVGFLPEHYFLYFEETDWCLDVKRSGYRIICQPKALVKHKNVTSLGFGSPLFTYYITRNQFYFYKKHLMSSVLYKMIAFSLIREIKRFMVDLFSGRNQNAFTRALGVFDFIRGKTGIYPWKFTYRDNLLR